LIFRLLIYVAAISILLVALIRTIIPTLLISNETRNTTYEIDSLAIDSNAYKHCGIPKYGDMLNTPLGIAGYYDYKQALACANEQNKPLFIDFTGHGCVNSREMEAKVWSNPEVLKRLKEDFVVVSLYVDDKAVKPKSEWYISKGDKKLKKTLGDQNADFQIVKYKTNSQPFYVIEDSSGKNIVAPISYESDVDVYIKFLDEAKLKYKQTVN
jgi:thioredoxin-related protein